jgi:hypothetical protein
MCFTVKIMNRSQKETPMIFFMILAMFTVSLPAAAGEFTAVQLAKVANNKSVVQALGRIKGSVDSLSLSVEPIAANESSGYFIKFDVTGTNSKGEALSACGFSVTLMTGKGGTINIDKALKGELDMGGSAECNGN